MYTQYNSTILFFFQLVDIERFYNHIYDEHNEKKNTHTQSSFRKKVSILFHSINIEKRYTWTILWDSWFQIYIRRYTHHLHVIVLNLYYRKDIRTLQFPSTFLFYFFFLSWCLEELWFISFRSNEWGIFFCFIKASPLLCIYIILYSRPCIIYEIIWGNIFFRRKWFHQTIFKSLDFKK